MLLAILLVSGLIYLRFRQANAVVNQGLALLDEPVLDTEHCCRCEADKNASSVCPVCGELVGCL